MIAIFGAGLWAGVVVIAPPSDPQPEAEPSLYTVGDGTIGVTSSHSVTMGWSQADTVGAPQGGTLTRIAVEAGTHLSPGDVLYEIDLEPALLAAGDVPAFRDLGPETSGADVEQLQAFLADEGLFEGEPTGDFGALTAEALLAWQEEHGLEQTGVLELGRLVFAPSDARVFAQPDLAVGQVLSPGEPVLGLVRGAPEAFITVAPQQSAGLEAGLEIEVDVHGLSATGALGEAQVQGDGSLRIPVTAADGAPLCSGSCADELHPSETSTHTGTVVTVPEASGPEVPTSAIRTDPGGSTVLTGEDGSEIEIEIVVSHGGLAIVEGIDSGAVIRVFGED